MFFNKMMLHTIATTAIQGMKKIAGITFTPLKAIAIILAINAIIRMERKTRYTGAIRYPNLLFLISNKPATNEMGRNKDKSNA